MKVIIDMYGGDNAPKAPILGAAMAAKELGVEIVAVGNEAEMRKICEENDISGFEFIDAPMVMPVCAEPTEVMKSYKESSLAVGLRALADGRGDAFVSAGSTGAIVVGATLIVKRIKGIKRAALASVIPGLDRSYMLLDLGANVECRPEMLCQFASMGSIYMNKLEGVKNPEVGLINIGAEESKGGELQKEAYKLLKESDLNFIGNVEPRDLPKGVCDVAVADGWTGNIVLKLTEGLVSAFGKKLKGVMMSSLLTKLGALTMKGALTDFKKSMDYTERGGAPLLGIAKPVIKAHGSSDPKAFMNAVRQAKAFYEQDVVGNISAAVAAQKEG
mgnify:FL=1